MPPVAPSDGKSIDLRVSKRLLRMGDAAYPLHNLVRVYTTEFKPKRSEAFWHFVIGETVALYAASEAPELRVIGLVVAITLLVRFLKVLASPSKYALAIDTSGEVFGALERVRRPSMPSAW